MTKDDLDGVRQMLVLQRTNWPEMSPDQAGTAIALQRLSRLIERAAQIALEPFDLSVTEFEMLCALRAQPAPRQLTPSALYAAMLISSGGLTKVLNKAQSRKLIDRVASETDGRSRLVVLTETGATLVERAMEAVQQVERPIIDAMRDEVGSDRPLADLLVALSDRAEMAGFAAPD